MSVKIVIKGKTPIAALADLVASGMCYMSNPDVARAAQEVYRSGLPTEAANIPEPYAEEPPHGTPSPAPAPAPAAKPVNAPTAEETRAAGIAAAKAHGQAAVKAILSGRFGVPNISSLAASDRAAFIAALKELDNA